MTTGSAASGSASSPPVHATAHSGFQPKRPTLSRFFKRYPYGEQRRSRAVAPAELNMASTPAQRRRKAAAEFAKSRDGSVAHVRREHRFRALVGEFMGKLYVELFFVLIVLFYGIFVIVQMTMDDALLTEFKSAIDITDITVGSILLFEIVLKIFAYGFAYLQNGWALFDAIVIVASFALGIVAAAGTSSGVLLRILRMRVLLRILRVLVVFERLKERSRSMKLAHKTQITSPVELVLRLLNDLRHHPAIKPSVRNDIDYAIDAIKNNRLYDAAEDMLEGGDVDMDTQQWLRGEMLKVDDTAKALEEEEEEDLEDEDTVEGELHDKHVRGRPRKGSANGSVGSGDGHGHGAGHSSASVGRRSAAKMTRGVTMKDLLPPLELAAEVELQSLLQSAGTWTFDIFRVDTITDGNALCHIGYHLLHDLADSSLLIEQNTLVSFLLEIQRGYIATNPYHNAIHAADVLQSTYYFLLQPELSPFLRPLDRILAMISAIIHDFKHDGFNNSFHISTASEIALRYNDHAVLENFHVAQSFLVMKNPELNILGKLAPEDFKYGREMIIQMVLATDMAKHFEDVALFKTNILPPPDQELAIKTVADKKLLLKMILHTCDVSNPAKERETMLRWTERVVEEFFLQGDMEKQLALAVSPFMDRDTIVLKKMQVGFADFIVAPLFSVWAQILPNVNTGAYKTLLSNREFWFNQSEDFKPHMIKDVVRDLSQRKGAHHTAPIAEEESPSPERPNRVRRSISNLLISSEDV